MGAWVVKQLFGKAGLQNLYCRVTLGKMVCCSGPRSSLFGKWSYRCFLITLPPSHNLGFQTVVLKTLESPLDCKEIKPGKYKGNQPWIFTGGTDAEAEAPIFGHLLQRAHLLEKTLRLGKIEGRMRRGWQRIKWLESITDSTDMNLRVHIKDIFLPVTWMFYGTQENFSPK